MRQDLYHRMYYVLLSDQMPQTTSGDTYMFAAREQLSFAGALTTHSAHSARQRQKLGPASGTILQ
jgi:hypothetical protein